MQTSTPARIVSIHTRHYWRVKPWGRCTACPTRDCFNPHPPLLAGETTQAHRVRGVLCSFNPHPPLLAGETGQSRQVQRAAKCFNPHPPLLAGETPAPGRSPPEPMVSIHTRHYWRVKRVVGNGAAYIGFNPHPPLLAGETRSPELQPQQKSACFNPHPPLLAGETTMHQSS